MLPFFQKIEAASSLICFRTYISRIYEKYTRATMLLSMITLSFRDFLQTVLIFRPIRKRRDLQDEERLNSGKKKLHFVYRMYDLNNDGSITRDEILAVLVMMVGTHVDREHLESIADRAILEVHNSHYHFRLYFIQGKGRYAISSIMF